MLKKVSKSQFYVILIKSSIGILAQNTLHFETKTRMSIFKAIELVSYIVLSKNTFMATLGNF